MTSIHCRSEISGFGKGDIYLKDSPRSHTFHITILKPKCVSVSQGLLKDLGLSLLYDVIFKFLSNDFFLHIIFWDHKLQSTFCVWYDWEWCYRFFYFIHIVQYCKKDYTHFHKDMDQRYQYRSYFNKRVLWKLLN